ncbi:MAG: DUF4301 family protein [Thermoanaerobaculia bacterium]
MADPHVFSSQDLEQISRLGMTLGHVEGQLEAYQRPRRPVELVRPCRPGDGIQALPPDLDALEELWATAAAEGRLTKFVPASGAASRMLSVLRWLAARPALRDEESLRQAAPSEAKAAEALRLWEARERLPFADEGDGASSLGDWVDRLLDRLGEEPKGLVPFHRRAGGARSAFEEQLVEAARYLAAGASRTCALQLTVAADKLERFTAAYDACRARLEEELGVRFDVEFSTQARSTDSLAVDDAGRPIRRPDGRLLFRPSGHGALLRNLAAMNGDVVFIKNIDNVLPESRHEEIGRWKRLLAGLALKLELRVSSLLDHVERNDPDEVERAVLFVEDVFGIRPPVSLAAASSDLGAWVRQRLDRPLRVCGMVPNEGQPGGGPFWVRDRDGRVSPQIVESGQVDHEDEAQQAIWASSTHFNPVDIVCCLLDRKGKTHDLERFVDHSASFIVRKEWGGTPIRLLERPGLWNGAMAGWNSVFVEVPASTFAPVKSLLDLLSAAHQR